MLIFTTNDLIYYNLISYFNKNSFCDKVINKYFIDKPVIIHKDNILIEKVNIVENIINLFPFIQEIDLNELANLNQHASYITYCFEVENEYYLFVLCRFKVLAPDKNAKGVRIRFRCCRFDILR